MVAYVVPAEKKETYTLTGAGAFVLTEEQRSARSLIVLAELILLSPPPRYFNFVYPEPQSFWGYCQWVVRDYILNTIQLEYRRQVLYCSDFIEGERNRQLLCLLGISQELAYIKLLDLLALLNVPAEDRAVFFENWKEETQVKFLNQVRPETALWYEVVPGFAMQITVIWIPHWEACKPGQIPIFLPPPRGTANDEQRPNDGGGGQQPTTPPPPGRTSDPLSDSPAPPPSDSSGPPSPAPAPPPGPTIVRASYRLRLCVYSTSTQKYSMRDSFGSATGPAPFTVLEGSAGGVPTIWVVDAAGVRTRVLSGQSLTTENGCPENASVVILSQVPI